MAALSMKEKSDIKELKAIISKSVFTVAKIQDTTPIEQELLQMAIDYISVDRMGDYAGRMAELNRFRYMIDGILYNHLDSKQLNFGLPQKIEVTVPTVLLPQNDLEEPVGAIAPFPDFEEPI